MKRVVFGIVWFVVFFLGAVMVVAGIIGYFAGQRVAEHSQALNLSEGYAAGFAAGSADGAEFGLRYPNVVLWVAFLLSVGGTAAGILPGTQPKPKAKLNGASPHGDHRGCDGDMSSCGPTTPNPSAEGGSDWGQERRVNSPIVQSVAQVTANFRRYPITGVIIGVCVINFLVVNLAGESAKEAILRILAPPPFLIWGGTLWGLATSAFVHREWWHILFNMLCARDFGRAVEPDMGARRYVAFVLAAAVVASGWQLLVSATGGIGFSGVVYALFGFMLARRGSRPAYQAILTRGTIIWLLGWLIFCFALTAADVASIGNAAHIGGLAFGYLVGKLAEGARRRLVMAGLASLGLGVVMATVYMPWSIAWNVRIETRQMDILRRAAEAGNTQAQGWYGLVLARLTDRSQAVPWLRRSAEAGDPVGMMGLAWLLATAPEDSLRNGNEAVRWAEKAYRLTPTPEAADTLAAAYAETDRWDQAIALEKSALRDVAPSKTDYVRGFEDRLERYKKHQKWRDSP